MNRLLTEEERNKFSKEAERRANDLQQSTEGNFNPADIEGIYLDADLATLKAQNSKTLKAVTEDYYCIPFRWCNMSPGEHFDGMGGCWGISGGDVLKKGRDYCKGCKYYRK
jgi:hypothetical protein